MGFAVSTFGVSEPLQKKCVIAEDWCFPHVQPAYHFVVIQLVENCGEQSTGHQQKASITWGEFPLAKPVFAVNFILL
jgi:hypothetical protein